VAVEAATLAQTVMEHQVVLVEVERLNILAPHSTVQAAQGHRVKVMQVATLLAFVVEVAVDVVPLGKMRLVQTRLETAE
jgi:hypothetical protein